MSGFIEDAAPEEDLGHRSILGRATGLKGGNELSLIDQPPLECEQAEKEFAGCVTRVASWGSIRAQRGRRRGETALAPGHGAAEMPSRITKRALNPTAYTCPVPQSILLTAPP